MIVDMIRGDVIQSNARDILFAINTSGACDAGFAGLIARHFWGELESCGDQKLGTILTHDTCKDEVEPARRFHALVCHVLTDRGGWKKTPEVVQFALDDDEMDMIEPREPLAVVMIGGGPVGQATGADTYAIMGAMARAKRRVVVYTL